MSNVTEVDLIFSSQQANHNFSHILNDLKRSNLSIANRLQSIQHDAEFVARVAAAYQRPLVANERCGSWYVDPKLKRASAYFKSTDGHAGQWKFSTRRLNLHLLELISCHDGCIIVDSTRRGKGMPDALSKTVPIWCSVLNRVLFPDDASRHALFVPPAAVSAAEHSQMAARLPDFVAAVRRLGLDEAALRARLRRPVRPLWVTQETPLPGTQGAGAVFDGWLPVICCTCSKRVRGTEMSAGGYIQGAADDTENWARGLSPALFWENIERLLATPASELDASVEELVSGPAPLAIAIQPPTELTPHLYVGQIGGEAGIPRPGLCEVVMLPDSTKPEGWTKSPLRMEVGLGKHKVASRKLREGLPRICSFVSQYLGSTDAGGGTQQPKHVLITCKTGKDLSIGVALAISCQCFAEDGGIRRPQEEAERFTKEAIRKRLGRMMTALPDANPSRATLQSVNSFLMDWHDDRG